MRKKIKIALAVILMLFLVNWILVRVQGVTFKNWLRLGCPNAIKVFIYNAEEYPGHTLDCMRFPKSLMKDKKNKATLKYTEPGTGINCKGYHVHIGDSREHVKEQFSNNDPEGDGTEYELGCYYCETDYFLIFDLKYDTEDRLNCMTITKRYFGK